MEYSTHTVDPYLFPSRVESATARDNSNVQELILGLHMIVLIECWWLHGYLGVPFSHHLWIASCGCLHAVMVVMVCEKPPEDYLINRQKLVKHQNFDRPKASVGHIACNLKLGAAHLSEIDAKEVG